MDTQALEKFDPFVMMDALDDKLILAEIEGRLTEAWFYHFPAGASSKEVWGISKVGIDEAADELSHKGHILRELSIDYRVCPISAEHVKFTARAA